MVRALMFTPSATRVPRFLVKVNAERSVLVRMEKDGMTSIYYAEYFVNMPSKDCGNLTNTNPTCLH